MSDKRPFHDVAETLLLATLEDCIGDSNNPQPRGELHIILLLLRDSKIPADKAREMANRLRSLLPPACLIAWPDEPGHSEFAQSVLDDLASRQDEPEKKRGENPRENDDVSTTGALSIIGES